MNFSQVMIGENMCGNTKPFLKLRANKPWKVPRSKYLDSKI